jgi:hypothetical protein
MEKKNILENFWYLVICILNMPEGDPSVSGRLLLLRLDLI